MTTTLSHNASPLMVYTAQLRALHALRARTSDPVEAGALEWAIEQLKGTEYTVRQRQRRFDTRHYCQLCYAEIPQGAEQHSLHHRGHYHELCLHLLSGRASLPKVRAELTRGTFVHAPCYEHRYKQTCLVLDKGHAPPTIATKRTIFEEPR